MFGELENVLTLGVILVVGGLVLKATDGLSKLKVPGLFTLQPGTGAQAGRDAATAAGAALSPTTAGTSLGATSPPATGPGGVGVSSPDFFPDYFAALRIGTYGSGLLDLGPYGAPGYAWDTRTGNVTQIGGRGVVVAYDADTPEGAARGVRHYLGITASGTPVSYPGGEY